jgi:hypothetical protein
MLMLPSEVKWSLPVVYLFSCPLFIICKCNCYIRVYLVIGNILIYNLFSFVNHFMFFIDILEIVASWPFIRYNFQNINKNMK